MKKSKSTFINRLPYAFWAGLFALLVLTACNKDEEEGPVITNIRAISPAPNDSSLTTVSSGDLIVIQGRNLATVQYVYFNGTAAALNQALAADDNVVVTVPEIPYAELDEDQLNKIRLVTEYGEVTYSFPVEPPPPLISRVSNEYTNPGETMTIFGQYFFLIESVTFEGDAEASDFEVNPEGTTITFTVPQDAQPGDIVVEGFRGSTVYKTYQPQEGILTNFDDIIGAYAYWGPTAVTDDPALYPGNTGSYAQIDVAMISPANFEWWTNGRSVNFNAATFVEPENLDEPVGSYALKFEIFVKEPWSRGTIIIRKDDDWTHVARYAPYLSEPTGTFETDGWQTVIIPFTQFRTQGPNGTDGTGNPAGTLDELLVLGDGQGALGIMLINDTPEDLTNFDAAFDNFRISKIE